MTTLRDNLLVYISLKKLSVVLLIFPTVAFILYFLELCLICFMDLISCVLNSVLWTCQIVGYRGKEY